MAAGDEDPPDAFEDEDTHLDRLPLEEGVPEEITPKPDTTGRHQTLKGYVDRELEIAQARVEERAYVLMAIKLMMMEVNVHVLAADAEIAKIERWVAIPENDHLVRVALKRA